MSAIALLTPTLHGTDGLSGLARQLRDALTALHGDVQVINLEDGRFRFGRDVCVAAAASERPCLAVVTHLHLMPAVWPLIWRGVPVVPVLVGIEAWEPLRPVRARALRRVPRAIAISRHTEREFKRSNPEFRSLGVDVCWPAAPALAATAPSSHDDSPFALIVGRLAANERYKGHDELIQIWPRVRERVGTARLVVAGTGDDLPRLRARVHAAGLSDAIQFEERVSDERLAELYRDCAFFVLPSRREGFGYVVLEAMQAGRACIAGRGAAEEIIDHGRTGIIVEPTAPSELTAAVVDLFIDPGRAEAMGRAGRERARQLFSMTRFTDDLSLALRPWLHEVTASVARC